MFQTPKTHPAHTNVSLTPPSHTYTHTRARARTHTHAHTHTHTHTHTHARTHTNFPILLQAGERVFSGSELGKLTLGVDWLKSFQNILSHTPLPPPPSPTPTRFFFSN